MLMKGNQTMAAVALGMIAQDLFMQFNEFMKERMQNQVAKDISLKLKTGYKKGIIRIWQKMGEYSPISKIKQLYQNIQVWMFISIILLLIAQFTTAMIYNINNEHNIVLLQTRKQIIFIILLPASIVLYVLAWNLLKGMKPKNYKTCINIWNGFVWHFFKPRTKKGLDLI